MFEDDAFYASLRLVALSAFYAVSTFKKKHSIPHLHTDFILHTKMPILFFIFTHFK